MTTIGDGFDPKVHETVQKLNKQVFGDLNEVEEPVAQVPIPRWDKEERKKAQLNLGRRPYFVFPGAIKWENVPKIKLKGIKLRDAKRAERTLGKRMRVYLTKFSHWKIDASIIMSLLGDTAAGLRKRNSDPIRGHYQLRTYAAIKQRPEVKIVPLKGSVLLKIWKRFGIDVHATWSDQADYDPRVGAPMSSYGTAIRRQHSGWEPGTWVWHKNEFIKPNKLYDRVMFPEVNIRLLFHLISKHRLVYTNPIPGTKPAR